ncbi:MAG: helix-turn-helix transcriptional regulator [Succinivibrio sp.]|nr:helix-turn-helix transcriptional regulator [Succinivibrio sp.]
MATLKKELKENIKHGSNVYPLAAYVCRGKKFNVNIGMHWHPEVEINRFESGDFVYNYAMQEYKITSPCIAITPGNVLHNLMIKRGANHSSILFNPAMIEFCNYDEVQVQLCKFLNEGCKKMPPLITSDMECFAKADKILGYIVNNASKTDGSTRLRIKAHLIDLLALMYENGIFLSESLNKNDDFEHKQQKIKDLLTFINDHYAEKITMNDAANYLNVSKQYFCRYFKKSTGMSFVDFINDLRLRRASQEIALTSKSITDIALDHGFDNIGYFFKLYKLKFGQTPLSYRKNKSFDEDDDSDLII